MSATTVPIKFSLRIYIPHSLVCMTFTVFIEDFAKSFAVRIGNTLKKEIERRLSNTN